jgi:YesN/AraC family two-component response regulator
MVLMDVEKMIYELNIDRRAVFEREPSIFLLADSCRSIEEMERTLAGTCERLIACLNAKPHALKSSIISPVVEYLQRRYMDEHISLESTAARYCINPSYLGQLMKKELGMTFLHCLSDIRIGHAKEGLARTNKPIQQIAIEAGYSNRSTFIRVFKNLVGVTPSDYRNRVLRDDGPRMPMAEGR